MKLAKHKELAPYDENWFYTRAGESRDRGGVRTAADPPTLHIPNFVGFFFFIPSQPPPPGTSTCGGARGWAPWPRCTGGGSGAACGPATSAAAPAAWPGACCRRSRGSRWWRRTRTGTCACGAPNPSLFHPICSSGGAASGWDVPFSPRRVPVFAFLRLSTGPALSPQPSLIGSVSPIGSPDFSPFEPKFWGLDPVFPTPEPQFCPFGAQISSS